MRKNYPVTQRNYSFPAHQTLISITDTKGRITYCNNDFITVSGYTKDELLGQPHNLLRHPDMPAEAFRDFWETVQAGRLWSAIIKNRRKNGDHYWVRANATPVRNGEQIVGYLSVRTAPSAQEIQAAEQLYTTMNQEAEAGKARHKLQGGIVRKTGLLANIVNFLHPTPCHIIIGLNLVLVAMMVGASVYSLGWPWQLALGVLIAIINGVIINKQARKPMSSLIPVARRLASGDLSDMVDVSKANSGNRRLLLPIVQLSLSTRTVMGDIRSDLHDLQKVANGIAASGQNLSEHTQAQTSHLALTAATMEQIQVTATQTSQLASQGVNLAQETTSTANRSQEAVQDMAHTMHGITRSSDRIGEITQQIEGVAFQTNILALNAAVESARAGEAGRGFAVVAAEVRSLAQHTTSLATEIRELIEEMQTRIETGSERADQAKTRMDEVMASVEKVGHELEQIDAAAQEQTVGIEQISAAISQLNTLTQQNAEVVQHLAQSAHIMDQQVHTAIHNLNVFRLSSSDQTHAELNAVQLRTQAKQLSS